MRTEPFQLLVIPSTAPHPAARASACTDQHLAGSDILHFWGPTRASSIRRLLRLEIFIKKGIHAVPVILKSGAFEAVTLPRIPQQNSRTASLRAIATLAIA